MLPLRKLKKKQGRADILARILLISLTMGGLKVPDQGLLSREKLKMAK